MLPLLAIIQPRQCSQVSKTSTDGQTLSASNLTIADPISGFVARLLFDREPSFRRWDVYDNAIETMKYLVLKSWNEALSEAITMQFPKFKEMLVIRPWPEGSSRLLVKYAVVAFYKAGTALAEIPITKRGYVPRLYAGLFPQNQQIGYLKWLHKSSSLESEPTGSLAKGTKKMMDPDDKKSIVTCEPGDTRASLPERFSALLEAIAEAAPHDNFAVGAYADGISTSGNVIVNVHGTGALPWENVVRSLFLIWAVIAQNNLVEFEFTFSYGGVPLGEGDILVLPEPARVPLDESYDEI